MDRRHRCNGAPGGRWTRHDVEAVLRRRIRDGTYPPGTRLPTHRDLYREFSVSSATLQHAFNHLIEFGLVRSRGSLGTFVQKATPDLSCVAMVFPDEPNNGCWNRFFGTLLRSSDVLQDGPRGARFRHYFITGGRSDSHAARCLLADAQAGVLSGIAFVYPPWYLDAGLFTLPLPRVVIGSQDAADVARYRASICGSTYGDTRDRVLRGFAAAGRRRLAMLAVVDHDPSALRRQAAAFGLETRPQWCLGLPVDTASAVSARTVVHLLCSKPPPDRPDCLLIEDDNLVPYATAGILDAGLRPADLAIAAHANFPDVTRSLVPCQRFGVDTERITALVLEEISRLAAGGEARKVEFPVLLRSSSPA